MDADKLKLQIGKNIAAYRKLAGLTQAGLAEKINYSDKAVSKWERGESMPDVTTLVQLAEQFDITVNDLLRYAGKGHDAGIGKSPEAQSRQEYHPGSFLSAGLVCGTADICPAVQL